MQTYEKNIIQNKPSFFEGKTALHLDTLAQLRKGLQNQPLQEGKKTLYKRAKAKYISNALALRLKDVNSELEQSYFRTYACASLLVQKDNKITGRYCNNRWCLVCNRIRTAKLINGYAQPLKKLANPYFVTLTIPNVKEDVLREEIKGMISKFRQIKDAARKAKIDITGIRKTECTYNRQRDDYHPHFHLIVEGKEAAQHIVSKWLQKYPEATQAAQDMRPADENSVYELFKYFTKLVYKSGTDIEALDNIFKAMQGLRTFQPMGIKKVSEEVDELQAEVFAEIEQREAEWLWVEDDWIDTSSGETLTGHSPSDHLVTIVSRFIQKKKNTPHENKVVQPPGLLPRQSKSFFSI